MTPASFYNQFALLIVLYFDNLQARRTYRIQVKAT